jgi:predicted NUDIX family NTP pyrophosphohydrolase
MMRQSAGILLYRDTSGPVEVLLVHPGGPMWAGKDEHAWSIPKGEFEDGETAIEAALREFKEETGMSVKAKDLTSLGSIKTSSKNIFIWFANKDFDPSKLRSNSLNLEWPPNSGKEITIPEVDKAEWFTLAQAKKRVHKSQVEFINRLSVILSG